MHIKVVCEGCGKELDIVDKVTEDDIVNYTVKPCDDCLDDAKNMGYDDGYDDGYNEGKADGFQAGCDSDGEIDLD